LLDLPPPTSLRGTYEASNRSVMSSHLLNSAPSRPRRCRGSEAGARGRLSGPNTTRNPERAFLAQPAGGSLCSARAASRPYTHIMPSSDQRAREAVDAAFRNLVGPSADLPE